MYVWFKKEHYDDLDSSEGDEEQDEDMIEVIVVGIWIFLVGLVKFCMHVLIWYPFLLGESKVFISAVL